MCKAKKTIKIVFFKTKPDYNDIITLNTGSYRTDEAKPKIPSNPVSSKDKRKS